MRHLHFTLGPVQAFVAEARRTRDLWAGSFLLSWLCASAMKAVLDGGGRIIFPVVHDAQGVPCDQLLKAVCGQGGAPRIGTIPNRFKAEIPDSFDPALPERAVRAAWSRVAHEVWARFVQPVAMHGRDTQVIWERQVRGFWEINWAVGAPEQTYLLDLRKNWRCFQPTEEQGEPCSVASGLQELSGYVRASGEGKQQTLFWEKLRGLKSISTMDLRESERLSAIMLIKRLFLKVSDTALGFTPHARSWPSTAHVAALPFKRTLIEHCPEAGAAYVRIVERAGTKEPFKERTNGIPSIPSGRLNKTAEDIAGLDGDLFFKETFEAGTRRSPEGADCTALKGGLEGLLDACKGFKSVLSPFFAVLLMDGDRLGQWLSAPGNRAESVSTALAHFANKVDDIVRSHDGFTIYAGGDDVLALLPVPSAIETAVYLKNAYKDAFRSEGIAGATISGGIVFAHYSTPWIDIMHSAHVLLDGKAKEEAGRNSLGIMVNKGGATNAEWVADWERVAALETLAGVLAGHADDRDVSMSLLYRMRSVIAELVGKPRTSAGRVYTLPDLEILPLLQAALQSSHAHRLGTPMEADHVSLAAAMVDACTIKRNGIPLLMPDGLGVARFLASYLVQPTVGGSHEV